MTVLNDEDRKEIRECDVEWNCHEIKIHQPLLEDGYEFYGYGVIKSLESGELYLDFICLQSNIQTRLFEQLPNDRLDERQSLHMKAKSLDGIDISSKELRWDMCQSGSNPSFYRISLKTLEIINDSPIEDHDFLYLEFNEKCMVPTNKLNKKESTLGSFSASWNQSTFTNNDLEVNIIEHDKFTEIRVKGNALDFEAMNKSILFYLGFTSGKCIQPFYEYNRTKGREVTKINSIYRQKIKQFIPPPISDSVRDESGENFNQEHFDLLFNIYDTFLNNNKVFESIYSQWCRVWHSFSCPEFSVPMLTVAVAVEGVLNDVFIEKIREHIGNDEGFEREKKDLLYKINSLDDLSGSHKESIERFINNWGNVHSKKALQYLVKKEVIKQKQLTNWNELRNSSAHPKLMEMDEARMRKNNHRTIVCLGLFYRLTLNAFKYKGPQIAYENTRERIVCIYEYVNIIH